MLRVLVLTLGISLFSIGLFAQKISFDKTENDFGLIKKDAPAQHVFSFTNISKAPIKLRSVKASCGCTTPNWTQEEIAPGKTGSITVSYNTSRVGSFYKSVTVEYDSIEKPIMLYIKGDVLTPTADDPSNFTQPMGNVAFEKTSVNVGSLDSDKSTQVTFRVRNNGPMPIAFMSEKAGAMMAVTYDKRQIAPGEVATIFVNVLGQKFTKWGDFAEDLVLTTNEGIDKEKVLNVSGFLNKIWTAEELAMLPNIEFEKTEFSGGKVLAGEKVTYTYKFTNTGKEDLVIESVKASCGCTASAPKDKIVKGGESSEIVATFDSRGRSGLQTKTVTVTSNDPDKPNTILKFSVEVELDPFHATDLGPASGSNK